MNTDILRFDGVTVDYGRNRALDGVTLNIHCGDMVALLGPNGGGKSTLLKAALGWRRLTRGRVMLGDDHIEHHRPRLAYLPQRHQVDLDFPITVRALVEQGLFASLGAWRAFGAREQARVDAAIEELEIAPLVDRPLAHLSGGQRQRVFLARALAQGADIFLLDEPFDGLDPRAQDILAHTLTQWHARHRTVIAVVHDLALVRRLFPHAVLLDRTVLTQGDTASVLDGEVFARTWHRDDVAPRPSKTAPADGELHLAKHHHHHGHQHAHDHDHDHGGHSHG